MHKVLFATPALIALSFFVITPSHAGEGVADPEQPFCKTADSFVEYVKAMLKEDEKWMKSVPNCALLRGGTKLVIIEPAPGTTPVGPIAKARVFAPNGMSIVGYTFYFGHD